MYVGQGVWVCMSGERVILNQWRVKIQEIKISDEKKSKSVFASYK